MKTLTACPDALLPAGRLRRQRRAGSAYLDEAGRRADQGQGAAAGRAQDLHPVRLRAQGRADPFNPNKLLAELAKQAAASGASGLKPDTERRKELLETYPLDTIKMVGTIEKKA
jgi:Tfp pilus assembly protein PilP